MIKREHLKQAIDGITVRAPEIGYSLDKMLRAGQIDAPAPATAPKASELNFYFLDRKMPVRAHQFLNEGSSALEERLLIGYGELAAKKELMINKTPLDYRRAAMDIHRAGFDFLIHRQIEYSVAALRQGQAIPQIQESGSSTAEQKINDLNNITTLNQALPVEPDDSRPFFQGIVNIDTPAYFINLPYTLTALSQAAEINLDFFSIRFLLDCFTNNLENRIYAALVNRRIAGLLYLIPRRSLLDSSLEIKYIASVRGQTADPGEIVYTTPSGVGSLLVAGAWMLSKTVLPKVNNIRLESELGAHGFYEAIGFKSQSPYQYYLDKPRGHLLKNIISMTGNLEEPPPELITEILKYVKIQFKVAGSGKIKPDAPERSTLTTIARECLKLKSIPRFYITGANLLVAHKALVPDGEKILSAYEYARPIGQCHSEKTEQQILVVFDERYYRHLENIFHLENPKRIEAMRAVLDHTDLKNGWALIEPRSAQPEELQWIHTPDHVQRVASTAGKPVSSFDLDTQTSERTYEVARLAVGGLFNLLDEIQSGSARRGFALIRPPGHHAEPDKAMGYCFFNNAALGAEYLKRRHALKRVMIVDIDAHHGNGTQNAFYESRDTLYFSIHQFPFFPGTGNLQEIGRNSGKGYTVNVPLARGADDKILAQAIYFLVKNLAAQYRPETILVSCGFDFYLKDPAAQMNATPEGYALMTSILIEIAEEICRGKICFLLEGGYSFRGIRDCGLAVMKELHHPTAPSNGRLKKLKASNPEKSTILKKVASVQKDTWTFF